MFINISELKLCGRLKTNSKNRKWKLTFSDGSLCPSSSLHISDCPAENVRALCSCSSKVRVENKKKLIFLTQKKIKCVSTPQQHNFIYIFVNPQLDFNPVAVVEHYKQTSNKHYAQTEHEHNKKRNNKWHYYS
jgi:hypothetical protein